MLIEKGKGAGETWVIGFLDSGRVCDLGKQMKLRTWRRNLGKEEILSGVIPCRTGLYGLGWVEGKRKSRKAKSCVPELGNMD